MKAKFVKRALAWVLSLCLVVGLVPASILAAAAAEGETIYVLAGSDFQPTDGDPDTGVTLLNQILTQVGADYSTMNGFLFAGDYTYNYTVNETIAGKEALQNAVLTKYPGISHEVYAQGNHDSESLNGSTLSASGANDADDYGVFVINENDYMWASTGINPTTVQNTANSLKGYLDAKRNAGYTKPIFVVSHLPLHYCLRTALDGDGMYANYIFDVLNEAGNAGLNIIFMFGHNHSNGWDDPLGGAAIYLKKGDKINIAQGSQTNYAEETLAFTYLNAGYVSYYRGVNSGSETDLTMTVFEITDATVTVNRYSAAGLHDMKSKGVANSYKGDEDYAPNTDVYTSPQTITLSTEVTPAGSEVTAPDSDGTATQRTYTRVTDLSQLVSGGQYLLIENGSTDYFMLPESISNSAGDRVGYNTEATSVAGGDTISGDYQAKEWTMTGSGTRWVLSTSAGSAYMEYQSNSRAYGRISSTNSSTITIGGSADAYSFTTTTNGYTYVFDHSSAGMINGYVKTATTLFYIYRMTDEGSGTPTVDTTGGNWVTITEPVAGGTIYTYELATSIAAGEEYVIVGNNHDIALMDNSGDMGTQTVTISGSTMTSTVALTEWTFSSSSRGTIYNGTRYLRYNNGFSLNRNNSTNLTFTDNGSNFRIYNNAAYGTDYSFYYNGSSWTRSRSTQYVRLYKSTGSTPGEGTPGLYGKISGELTYNVEIGTSEADAIAAVKAGIDILYHTGDANAAQTFPDDGEGMTWKMDPAYDGITPGEYAVTIAYDGVVLGVAKVVVPSVAIKGYSVDPLNGTVFKGSSQTAQPGSTITVTLEGGSYYNVPVTVSMLKKADGSAVSTGVAGTYENLTLTYNGVVISQNYTLVVTEKVGNDYPEYPEEGAVKVNKTAIGIDFQSTGVAKVELSASGVPVKKGADVIVMLDTSSSMNSNKVTVNGVEKTRLTVLKESLQSMLTQLQANGADGAPMDIRIAVADFNRYYTDSSSPYYINSADTVGGGSIRTNDDGTNLVYTGSGKLDADAFVDVHTLQTNAFNGITYESGTNYDYAFDAVYQLGEAITAENATVGEERDLFVIFMSDGAPYQYNYFSSQSEGTGAADWNDWLQGTLTTSQFDNGANQSYYNADGKHWMAEAIKGDPTKTYPVIRKNNAADTDGDNWVDVNGLGATMFSIGFCLAVDKEVTVASMDAVIRNIASTEDFYFRADSAKTLSSAFASVGNEIAYAAYGARFVDTMGESFDLQLSTTVEGIDNEGNPVTITLPTAPAITVLNYDIWTRAEYEAGDCNKVMIGMRKGTSNVLETVTFNATGTEAYSNGGTTNILIDGVICADSFWYNTTAASVMIDTNGDGVDNYELAPETFYWNIGSITTQEIALSYYVYLEGSQEGDREAGAYETNESAILYYTNYLGTENCEKHTVSPKIAWESANVSYGFYLVDANGNPIVNQATGQTGTFANAVRVTAPQLYNEILLNNLDQVNSINVASLGVLPEGYTLYDEAATYTIVIKGNSTGSWTIVKGDGLVDSTYVTQFSTTLEYSNELSTDDPSYDFTHTIVWFAVKFEIKPIPDTVVIDYGLSVDISALANDMFGGKGTLSGVGSTLPANGYSGGTIANGFGTTLNATYGTAEVNATNGTIKYTPNTMQMPGYDRFAYAVNYTGSSNAGYYYSLVTVIPATSVYYEDNGGWITYGGTATWGDVEDGSKADSQGEDRPGTLGLSGFDANNIYGYDGAYATMSTYSNGSAKKVTVDANTFANAKFSFYGTGFDVISMTSSQTGVLKVKVFDAEGGRVANMAVDTYYGYTKDADGNWAVTNDAANALYQVPVIQISGLDYGLYSVEITASYYDALNNQQDGSYDLYLDAIRVYDPAGTTYDATDTNGNETQGNIDDVIQDAYLTDGEAWPRYFELRSNVIDAAVLSNGVSEIAGLVFIDGVGATASATDYTNFGPNNELYLDAGQAVAFNLDLDGYDVAAVHLGIKSANGVAASYQIFDANKVKIADDLKGIAVKTVNTATDMYYDITSLKGKTIVVYNPGTAGILSLTDIKVTFNTDPGEIGSLFTVDAATIADLTNRLNKTYTPEYITVTTSPKKVYVGNTIHVTVTTSADVEAVDVNGTVIDTYRVRNGKRVWTYNVKAESTQTFTVTAYGTEAYYTYTTDAVTVEAGTHPLVTIINALKKIFGWS